MSTDEKMNNVKTWVMTAIVVAVVILVMVHNRQLAPLSKIESGQSPTSQTPDQKPQPSPEVKPKQNPISQEVSPSPYLDGTVVLAGQVLQIQLADDLSEQLAGLANRTSMAENEGMLFALAKTYIPEFWMKDMLFPLDIIWIRDGKVVDISTNLAIEPGKTDNELKRYLPREAVDMVLEINASWAEKNNLSIGDEVKVGCYGHLCNAK